MISIWQKLGSVGSVQQKIKLIAFAWCIFQRRLELEILIFNSFSVFYKDQVHNWISDKNVTLNLYM